MPFACIFVPDFSLQAILRAEPSLRSQAVAVLEGKPPLEKILVANEHARTAGVLGSDATVSSGRLAFTP